MTKLGVNIDHVATLREARKGREPDPLLAAQICEEAGAHSIVAHLREDRRHINETDIQRLRKNVKTRFNLELSLNPEITKIALSIRPDQATFVPERRQEITTEGGLDVVRHYNRLKKVTQLFAEHKIVVSLFVDPIVKQIKVCRELEVNAIELHTGTYASANTAQKVYLELQKLKEMTGYAKSLGLVVNAGHGLNYQNIKSVSAIKEIAEFNIGHSIIARSVTVGIKQAVKEMIELIHKG